MAKRSRMKSAVFEKFTITSDEKHFVCQCMIQENEEEKHCNVKISTYSGSNKYAPTRASNLKRHLRRLHPKIFKAVVEKDDIIKNVIPNTLKIMKDQKTEPKYLVDDQITIKMTAEMFKAHIIELIFKKDLPISLFAQPAFVGLVGEMAQKLGVSLDKGSIIKMAIEGINDKTDLHTVFKDHLYSFKTLDDAYNQVNEDEVEHFIQDVNPHEIAMSVRDQSNNTEKPIKLEIVDANSLDDSRVKVENHDPDMNFLECDANSPPVVTDKFTWHIENLSDVMTCNDCDFISRHTTDMLRHISVEHKDDDIYSCDLCVRHFTQDSSLQRHLNNCHAQERRSVKCPICNFTAPFRSLLFKHINITHETPHSDNIKKEPPID